MAEFCCFNMFSHLKQHAANIVVVSFRLFVLFVCLLAYRLQLRNDMYCFGIEEPFTSSTLCSTGSPKFL